MGVFAPRIKYGMGFYLSPLAGFGISNMNGETLILVETIVGNWILKTVDNHTISKSFTKEQAEKWCKENGYRMRIQYFRTKFE